MNNLQNLQEAELILGFILFCACCILDLWITVQPDDGLYKKPEHVAEIVINIQVALDSFFIVYFVVFTFPVV